MKTIRLYDSRRPPEPSYPAINPSVADFTLEDELESLKSQDVELKLDQGQLAEAEILHAPPGLVFSSFLQSSPGKTNSGNRSLM